MRSRATFDEAMRTSPCAALGLLLVACTSAPTPHLQHPFVGRFADALAFVPPGMDRLMLTDCEIVAPGAKRTSKRLLEVRCGRAANVPEPDQVDANSAWSTVLSRRQWFEGVTIADYGAAGVPREEFEALGEPQGTIAGRTVRVRGEHQVGLGQTSPATWSAVFGDRFLVVADSAALLELALSRPHGDIAATLMHEVELGADAGWVVFEATTRTWTVADRTGTRFELCWPEAAGQLTELVDSEDEGRIEDLGRRGSHHRWRCSSPHGSVLRDTLVLTAMGHFGYLITI